MWGKIVGAVVLLGWAGSVPAGEGPPAVTSERFPSVSRRVAFFDRRIRSPDAAIRRRVVLEAGYFFIVPDREYTAFLKWMLRDGDPRVASDALRKLHDLFVPLQAAELPKRFYCDDGFLVDLADRSGAVDVLRGHCEGGLPIATWALALLGGTCPTRRLEDLARSDNISSRYSAARCLLNLGRGDLARPILRKMVQGQLDLYARLEDLPEGKRPPDGQAGTQPYYAAAAARALMELGAEGRKEGLAALKRLMAHLQRSSDPNDRNMLHSVRVLLAGATGRWPQAGQPAGRAAVTSADFPSVAQRVAFFAERVNSGDAATRLRVMTEAGYFFIAPDREYQAFLKRMLRDGDPRVAGEAVRRSYDLFIPVEADELPRRFTGYAGTDVIDLADRPAAVARLVEACGAKGHRAGWAAYALGLLRDCSAIPALRKLTDDANVFTRYTAARALITMGEIDRGRRAMRAIIESQLAGYGKPLLMSGTLPSGHYAAQAARALMGLDRDDRRVGLAALVDLMARLERSRRVPDWSDLHWLRLLLANVTGLWLPHHADARRYYEQFGAGGT